MSKQIKVIEPERLQKKTEKLKVCAYSRVSTDSAKQHTSYLAQVNYYENYIKSNKNWQFVGIFADESSGTKLKNRDGFHQMIKACKQGKIDLIITKSVTRFARNTVDSIKTVRYLKSLGIAIYFEKENINTMTEQSEQMLTILSSIAQGESENISTNARWAIQKRFRDGSYNPPAVAYGYTKNKNNQLIIEPTKAQVIRRIFTEYLSGKGAYLIAKSLNDDKIPTIKNAKKWNDSVVLEILKNPIYEGKMLLQKTYTTENLPFTKKKNNGEVQQYLIEDNHEPIITKEQALKVREMIEYRKTTINQQTKKYEFSGKIKCSECGGTFRRQKIYIGTNYEKIQWCCKTHIIDKTKCSQKAIREDEIKAIFTIMYNKLASNFEEILHPMLESLKLLSLDENKQKIDKLERKIKEINEQSHILSQNVLVGDMDSALHILEQNKLNIELENTKKERQILLDNADFTEEITNTQKIFQAIKQNYKLQNEYQKEIFTQIVEEIYISNNEIEFKLKNGLKLNESRCKNAKQNTTGI